MDHRQRLKRGGGQHPIHLDTVLAEQLYREEPGPEVSADEIYDRRWALTLLEQTLARLRAEFESAGKLAEYEALKPCLTAARGDIAYPELAATLAMSEANARVAVHRLRKRYREIFRDEIAQTVADEADFDEELRHLMTVLGG